MGKLEQAGKANAGRQTPRAEFVNSIGCYSHPEFERVLGPRALGRWPTHRVLDGLDQLEVLLDRCCLIIHPRCEELICAFRNYCRRKNTGGDGQDEPADPQHPHEDLIDALRGGIRDRFPEGRIEQPRIRSVQTGRA